MGISYVFYQRDIHSKRLLTSIGIGIIASIILIIIQLIPIPMDVNNRLECISR
jgi:hypothetical protein